MQSSPNYPAYGLGECLQMAGAIWAKEKRTPVNHEIIVKALGYGSLNGTARRKLGALRQYGLIEPVSGGGSRLSDIAIHLIHGQPTSDEYRLALKTAATKPVLFRELLEKQADASDDALKSYLIVKRRFSEAGAKQAVGSFRNTLNAAGLRATDQPIPEPNEIRIASSNPAAAQHETSEANQTSGATAEPIMPDHGGKRAYSWGLSATVFAKMEITGEPELEDLQALREFVEITAKGLARSRKVANTGKSGAGADQLNYRRSPM